MKASTSQHNRKGFSHTQAFCTKENYKMSKEQLSVTDFCFCLYFCQTREKEKNLRTRLKIPRNLQVLPTHCCLGRASLVWRGNWAMPVDTSTGSHEAPMTAGSTNCNERRQGFRKCRHKRDRGRKFQGSVFGLGLGFPKNSFVWFWWPCYQL